MARTMQVQLQLDIDNAKRQINQLGQDIQKALKSGGGGIGGGGGSSSGGAAQAASSFAGFSKSAVGVAAAVAAISSEFNKLGDRARELAATAGNASSQLGQLRASMERNSISTDIAATSPSVVGFQKFISDVGTNIADFISHAGSTSDERNKAVQEKIAGGLGQGNEDWKRLKQEGADLAQDQSRAQTAMQVKYQRQARDFDLSQRKFQVDTENQKFDLQKQAARTQFDNQIAIQKFQENFANQQSQKAYDLSRQFANQSFAISQSRSIQDYSINRSDQQADFSKSIKDQQFDYNLNKSRSLEDRNIQLQSMALSGASGLDYFQAARSFNLQQSRAAQDLQISQARETRDYGIGQSRDARNFGISMGRSNQDFQQQAKEALASRQLELEAQDYARKYEGLELQTQINRSSEDLAISFQRLNQSIGFQQQGFANQASDMAYDKKLDYSNLNIQTTRQNRDYFNATADFAGQARSKDPLGAYGLSLQDPSFQAALQANAKQSGQTDLAQQVKGAMATNNAGGIAGDIFKKIITDPISQSIQPDDPKFWSLNPADWFRPNPKPDKSGLPQTGAGNAMYGDNNAWLRIADQAKGLAAKGIFSTAGGNQNGGQSNSYSTGPITVTIAPQDDARMQQMANDAAIKMANDLLEQFRRMYGG